MTAPLEMVALATSRFQFGPGLYFYLEFGERTGPNPGSEFGFGVQRKERAEPWFGRFRVRRKNVAEP